MWVSGQQKPEVRGQQLQYDYQKVWEYILDQIANGRTITSIVAEPSMPSYARCTLQLRNDPQLKERYSEAVDSRVEFMASEFIDLADSQMPEGLDGTAQSAWVQQLKLKLWARTWVMSKLKPRTYGERLDVSVTNTHISITEALKQAEMRLFDMGVTGCGLARDRGLELTLEVQTKITIA